MIHITNLNEMQRFPQEPTAKKKIILDLANSIYLHVFSLHVNTT